MLLLPAVFVPGFFHGRINAQERKPLDTGAGTRGEAAIRKLGRTLPELAAKFGLKAEELESHLKNDLNLWLDPEGNPLFADEFLPDQIDRSEQQENKDNDETTGDRFIEQDDPIRRNLQGAYPASMTFKLHSLPGASKVIYLDFDGHTTAGTYWNNSYGSQITSLPFDLDGSGTRWNTVEMDRIQLIWQRIAEDFLPFNIDVTTQDPGTEALRRTDANDAYYGVRVVISPSNFYSTGAGGVAYLGSFTWATDTPCYVFTQQLGGGNEKYTAEAASHEAGHTLGLMHDGITGGAAYYQGQGSWASIMGVGYYKSLVQWDKGEYTNANNKQDDLAVITGSYGVSFRTDDHGNAMGTATALTIANQALSGSGIIGHPTDKDYFYFTTGAGTINITVNPDPVSPNLDIKAELLNSAGTAVASSDPAGLSASLSANLTSGTYYLVIDGVGAGLPTSTGYSDFGSLGAYSITGNIGAPAGIAPIASVSATPTSGLAPLTVAFTGSGSSDPDGSIVGYAWNFGNGATSASADTSHTYNNKGTYTATLTVTDNTGLTKTSSVQINVTGAPTAPSGLTATAYFTGTQINLAWNDNATDETGYKIERSLNNSTWTQIATVGANAKTYSNTGLSTSVQYFYRVRATNAVGDSSYSNTASATTVAQPTIHVGNLSATSRLSGSVWSATVTITVHNANESPMQSVAVSGAFSNGSNITCTTGRTGQCQVVLSNISRNTASMTYTVKSLTLPSYLYKTTDNHDPDGSSNGTTITVRR
jgi:PKD repeat protein